MLSTAILVCNYHNLSQEVLVNTSYKEKEMGEREMGRQGCASDPLTVSS